MCLVLDKQKFEEITSKTIMKKSKTKEKKYPPPGGLEPPTFRLTAERASQLRHGGPYNT